MKAVNSKILRSFIRILSILGFRGIKYKAEFAYNYALFLATGRVPFPRVACIDVVNFCNLKCPLCPTGSGRLNCRRSVMALDVFKAVIDKIPSLMTVALFNWGEPFLNPQVFAMIDYAHKRNIKVTISSNLSLKRADEFFKKIVESGLDELMVSLDGASQENYSKYRVGGDFNLVIQNIKRLQEVKEGLGVRNPRIIYKFIVNKFNEGEIEAARKISGKLKIDFETAEMGLGDMSPDFQADGSIGERKAAWLPKNTRYIARQYSGSYRLPFFKGKCAQIFTSIYINPDGTVFPCCWLTNEKNIFGNLLNDPLERVWNSDKYTSSRNLFSLKRHPEFKAETICFQCGNFRKNLKKQIA